MEPFQHIEIKSNIKNPLSIPYKNFQYEDFINGAEDNIDMSEELEEKNGNYSADSIQVLEGLEAVRVILQGCSGADRTSVRADAFHR